MNATPWMGTLRLTTAGTKYQLSSLLTAKDADLARAGPVRAQYLLLLVDPDASTGTVYIGNSNVSATEYGIFLVANGSVSFPSLDANLINVSQIWLLSDRDNVDVHVTFITR